MTTEEKSQQNENELEGMGICEKCGSERIEEEGAVVCPKCDGEIDFFGDDEKDEDNE